MKKILTDQKGNLLISLIIATFALLSGLSITFLGYKDIVSLRYQLDATQETHLLRSEFGRGMIIIGKIPAETLTLPQRTINISHPHSDYKAIYKLKSKIFPTDTFSSDGLNVMTGKAVATLAKAYHRNTSIGTSGESPVKKYSERHIRKILLAGYFYFTDTDESENADGGQAAAAVYFWGDDELYGKVHTNSDMQIKIVSGHDAAGNDGYPLFHGFVTVGGDIIWSGQENYEATFQGGYKEGSQKIVFDATAENTRACAAHPFGTGPSIAHEIVYVKLNGGSYTSWYGNIITDGVDSLEIYPSWPAIPPNTPPLGYNVITAIDTLWEPGPNGAVGDGGVVFVHDELWIEGTIQGKQTWACADTVFITGDLLYQNTQYPNTPDTNPSDMLGLVSEKRIYIKYGHTDHADSIQKKPNCTDIIIYGALCALGDGGGGEGVHKDGIFSYEYQHPHRSTEHIMYQDTLRKWVDLHRYFFNDLTPWPPAVDYPWYNPLYPEEAQYLVFERGSIHLFGSVAQRRRGFVHRSGSDPANHDPQGSWDIENYYFGASHNPTGYEKDYHFDNRFSFEQPPCYPDVHIAGRETPYEGVSWYIYSPNKANF